VSGYLAALHHSGPPEDSALFLVEDPFGGASHLIRGFRGATIFPTSGSASAAFWHYATTQPDYEELKATIFTFKGQKL
jgi:hypothetical protein